MWKSNTCDPLASMSFVHGVCGDTLRIWSPKSLRCTKLISWLFYFPVFQDSKGNRADSSEWYGQVAFAWLTRSRATLPGATRVERCHMTYVDIGRKETPMTPFFGCHWVSCTNLPPGCFYPWAWRRSSPMSSHFRWIWFKLCSCSPRLGQRSPSKFRRVPGFPVPEQTGPGAQCSQRAFGELLGDKSCAGQAQLVITPHCRLFQFQVCDVTSYYPTIQY